MRRKIIIASIAGGLALVAGLVLLAVRQGALAPAASYAVIYEKGSENLFLALPEGNFQLAGKGSDQQVFSDDGKYFYYDTVAAGADDDAVYDLYLMHLKQSRSREQGGEKVAQGIRGAWSVSSGGRYAVWIESKGNVLQLYDAAQETAQELASGVEALYAAPGYDVFFFSKANGELFRCNIKQGQRPERMAGDVKNVQFFSGGSPEAPQVIAYYLQQAGESLDLYALGQTGGAVLVAQAPARVFFEDYTPGGNLYFLKQGQAGAASVTVEDPAKESDAAMQEPKKQSTGGGRISKWLSGVFGINANYEKEKAAYDKKLERDAVRAAASDALNHLPQNGGVLDCYVYDGESAKLLASGVRENGVAVRRTEGRPAVLYEKQHAEDDAGETAVIALDSLVASYRSGGVSAVRDAIYALTDSGAQSLGYTLAMMTATGPSEVAMGLGFGGSAGWEAIFLPGRETMLYLERDVEGGRYSFYSYDMTDYGLSERRQVDVNVEAVTPMQGGVYYSKQESDVKGLSLYYDAPEGGAGRALLHAGAFVRMHDAVLSMGGKDGDILYFVRGTQADELDAGVQPASIHAGAEHEGVAYACWLNKWEAGAGELRLFHQNAKGKHAEPKTLDNGVTAIRVVK